VRLQARRGACSRKISEATSEAKSLQVEAISEAISGSRHMNGHKTVLVLL